jgi:hypothetical protein
MAKRRIPLPPDLFQSVWTDLAKQYPEQYRFEYWKTMFEFVYKRLKERGEDVSKTLNITYKLSLIVKSKYEREGFISKEWIKAVAEAVTNEAIYNGIYPPLWPPPPPKNDAQLELERVRKRMKELRK